MRSQLFPRVHRERSSVTGDASESITFEGEWDKFYDIYAEDQDIAIFFETSQTHDPDYTYLLRCGVDTGSTIGISGDCGDRRRDLYLVGDFTVEASGAGDVTFTFDGTGEVMIVQSGIASSFGSLALMCLGCCLCPVLMILSGVKLGKGKHKMLLSSVVIRLVINKHYLSKHCLSKQSSRTVSALKQLSKAIRNPHQYSRRISLRGMHLLPLPTTRLHTSKPPEQTEATDYRAQGSTGEWIKFIG